MRVPLSWLREYVDVADTVTPEDVLASLVSVGFEEEEVHTFAVTDGAVATSGISRRSWIGGGGRPVHHLLDPRTGEPVFSGIVQASALAPTASSLRSPTSATTLSTSMR